LGNYTDLYLLCCSLVWSSSFGGSYLGYFISLYRIVLVPLGAQIRDSWLYHQHCPITPRQRGIDKIFRGSQTIVARDNLHGAITNTHASMVSIRVSDSSDLSSCSKTLAEAH
jgi:hypothetical protein